MRHSLSALNKELLLLAGETESDLESWDDSDCEDVKARNARLARRSAEYRPPDICSSPSDSEDEEDKTLPKIRRTMSMGYVNHDDSSELSDINSENSDDSSELSELEDQELPDNGGEGLCEQKEQNLLPDVGSSSGLSDLTDVSSDWATYGSRHPPVDDSDDNTHLGELSCSSGGDAALAKGSGQMLRREEISSLSSPLSLQPDTEELTMRVGNTQHGLSGSTKVSTPPARQ